jgi:hypothetical protein
VFTLRRTFFIPLAIAAFAGGQPRASAQTIVNLGTAESYAVLAGTSVSNTGPTTILGDLGVYSGSTVTGFPPGSVDGTMNIDNAAAMQAQADLASAYNNAAAQSPTMTYLPASDLGGLTLTPGVYNDSTTFSITGTLTLNAGGDANAVWIFQAGSTLTTATDSSIVLEGGAQAGNVFWQVGSSATLGVSSDFEGSVLAGTSITVDADAAVDGDLLARSGSVTLNTDQLTAIPEPPGTAMLVAGFVGLILGIRTIRRHGGTRVCRNLPA